MNRRDFIKSVVATVVAASVPLEVKAEPSQYIVYLRQKTLRNQLEAKVVKVETRADSVIIETYNSNFEEAASFHEYVVFDSLGNRFHAGRFQEIYVIPGDSLTMTITLSRHT